MARGTTSSRDFIIELFPDTLRPERLGSSYHVDPARAVRFFRDELPLQLAAEMRRWKPSDRPYNELREQLNYLRQHQAQILATLPSVIERELSVPYAAPTFSTPAVAAETTARFTMVEPREYFISPRNSTAEYRAGLQDLLAWEAMRDTLRHYGANVNVVAAANINGGYRELWARDPAVIINGTAYMPNDPPDPERDRGYEAYYRSRGLPVRRVDGRFEGGDIQFDPTHRVLLLGAGIGPDTEERVLHEKRNLEQLAKRAGVAIPFDRITKLVERNASSEEMANLFQQITDRIPGDIIVDGAPVRGRIYSSLYNFEQAYNTYVYEYGRVNRDADNLQRATGIPVIPIVRHAERFYHLDTFASVLPDGTLMVYPPATTPETMSRLRAVYGNNMIILNEQDVQALGSNLSQVGNYLITNGMSSVTRQAVEAHGYTVVTPRDLGFQYDFVVTQQTAKYGGAGIHCLTIETNGVRIQPNIRLDGEGTSFEAGFVNGLPPEIRRVRDGLPPIEPRRMPPQLGRS